MNKMPGAFKALTQKNYPRLALELQYKDPFSSNKQETSYFRPGTNINVRSLDNINMLKSIIPVPKNKENKTFPKPEFKPKPSKGFIDNIQNVLGRK